MLEIETPHGPARAYLHAVNEPRGALVLGHGAGGGVEAPDLAAATKAAGSEGITVALVEQPYRVAGRRSPSRAAQPDPAWTRGRAARRGGARAARRRPATRYGCSTSATVIPSE